MSSLVRDTLSEAFGTAHKRRRPGKKQFSFVGAGRSKQVKLAPVSERHDEALDEALLSKKRR